MKNETIYVSPTNIARKMRGLVGRTIVNVKQNGKRKTGGQLAITVA